MAKFYTELDETLRQFISTQHIFFNCSAPINGRINVSPKGFDTFRIINDKRVAYLDLTGSENETAAHIAENGRLTIMFCSFADKPLILRLYGKGRAVHTSDPEFKELHTHFSSYPGERQIIVLDIESVMSTCGFAVPLYDYQGERTLLSDFACKLGEKGLDEYRLKKNLQSIDGLPTHLLDDVENETAAPFKHYLLYYEKASDYGQRQGPLQAAHLEHVQAAANRGELVLAGSMADPIDGSAMLLFRSQTSALVEEFAKSDCYVQAGVVKKWYVREWTTVAGSRKI